VRLVPHSMHRPEQRIQNTQSSAHSVQIFRDVTYLSGFYPTSFFAAESSTQNGGECAAAFVNSLPAPSVAASHRRLLDFKGDRRRMAGRAGRSGDGHGAGSAGVLIPRTGTTATEQMKKDRHDAENL
jgi:hypothetical protein